MSAEEFGFEKGDTDGFVNYGLTLVGVKVSALFIRRPLWRFYKDFIPFKRRYWCLTNFLKVF